MAFARWIRRKIRTARIVIGQNTWTELPSWLTYDQVTDTLSGEPYPRPTTFA